MNGIITCITILTQSKIWAVSNVSSKKSYNFLMSYPMPKYCKQQQTSTKWATNMVWHRAPETLKSFTNALLLPSLTTDSHIPLPESLQKNGTGHSSTQLVISYIWAEKPPRRTKESKVCLHSADCTQNLQIKGMFIKAESNTGK